MQRKCQGIIESDATIVKDAYSSGVPVDFIELTLQHVILGTANQGGDSKAQLAASGIVSRVLMSPSGPLSHSIYVISFLNSKGYISLYNKIIAAIARSLAKGGNVDEIPNIVRTIIASPYYTHQVAPILPQSPNLSHSGTPAVKNSPPPPPSSPTFHVHPSSPLLQPPAGIAPEPAPIITP